MDLYREQILDHYKNPRNFGKIEDFDLQALEDNPLCGDFIGIQIKLNKNKVVREVRFFGEGCAISKASASMLTEKLKGKSLKRLSKIKKEDILEMLGGKITPMRLKCALLPLKSLRKAIDGKCYT